MFVFAIEVDDELYFHGAETKANNTMEEHMADDNSEVMFANLTLIAEIKEKPGMDYMFIGVDTVEQAKEFATQALRPMLQNQSTPYHGKIHIFSQGDMEAILNEGKLPKTHEVIPEVWPNA